VKGRAYQLMTEPKAKEQSPDAARNFDPFRLPAPKE
jgi:hypothetical protein